MTDRITFVLPPQHRKRPPSTYLVSSESSQWKHVTAPAYTHWISRTIPVFDSCLTAGYWSIVSCSWKMKIHSHYQILSLNLCLQSLINQRIGLVYKPLTNTQYNHDTAGPSIQHQLFPILNRISKFGILTYTTSVIVCIQPETKPTRYITIRVCPDSKNSRQWNKSRRIRANFWNTETKMTAYNFQKQKTKNYNKNFQLKFVRAESVVECGHPRICLCILGTPHTFPARDNEVQYVVQNSADAGQDKIPTRRGPIPWIEQSKK